MSCQRGEFRWEWIFNEGHCAEGRKASYITLKWPTEQPVWVDQWPLEKEKLNTLKLVVQEQLNQGHIEPSTSPWNTPVFVIKKKSGKWRLLHDLRNINAVMESMGSLQPGIPSQTIPAIWDYSLST